MFKFLILICLSLCVNLSAQTKETEEKGPLEGHSYHGEAFNEGPRSAAYLMKGTGEVEFHTSTKSDKAQKFFLQGLGQLHGFWYFEAERSFRQAALLDKELAELHLEEVQVENDALRATVQGTRIS